MNLRSAKKLLRLENLLLWINSVNLLINGSYLPPNKSLLLAARTLLELNCRLLVTDGKVVSFMYLLKPHGAFNWPITWRMRCSGDTTPPTPNISISSHPGSTLTKV